MKIAAYAIAKNEAKFAERWAECTEGADWRTVLVDIDSHDNTASLLRDAGVNEVVLIDYKEGFRFDAARNWALRHLPQDIDLCISLDMDEYLEGDFIGELRKLWEEQGPFDKALPQIFTSSWWPCERVHARHGYVWVGPCHETTVWTKDSKEKKVAFGGQIITTPDTSKPRDYVPLLKIGVRERPHDVRAWTYLARELFTTHQPKKEIMEAINSALPLNPPEHERALLCRMAATTVAGQWLELAATGNEPEALHDLARHEMNTGNFLVAAQLAARAHRQISAPLHYLASQDVRTWGCADIASHCFAALGDYESAEEWASIAVKANPALQPWLEAVQNARKA